MKNILKITILLSLVLTSITSCDRDEELNAESVLTSSPVKETELDKWLLKNFVEPYNIALVYKYQDTKLPQRDYVIPVSYKKSVEMANIIKYLFLDAYAKHTPKNFLKKYGPKTIILIGSGAYNPNGTVKLGLAENGVQFSLLDVNNLDVNNVEALYARHFRTIYHEFSHILHQTKDYTSEFKEISAKDYVGDTWQEAWRKPNNNSRENMQKPSSLEAGFLSDYSTKDSNEDFVELIAHYFTYSPDKWNQTLEKAAGENGDKPGKEILQRKIAIVKDYMQKEWNINMDDLRDEIQTRAANIGQLEVDKLK